MTSTVYLSICLLVFGGCSLRGDKVIAAAVSPGTWGPKMKAEFIETNDGSLFGRKYCMQLTNLSTSFSYRNDLNSVKQYPDTELPKIKLYWDSDSKLVLDLPNDRHVVTFLNIVHDTSSPNPER